MISYRDNNKHSILIACDKYYFEKWGIYLMNSSLCLRYKTIVKFNFPVEVI